MLEDFVSLLGTRLAKGVFTTEDSIRYTFYAALINSGVSPDRVVIEYKHPTIEGAHVDTVIFGTDNEPAAILEFKYNRSIPSGRNIPLPQAAGSLFSDLSRLLAFDGSCTRYFVHVTDGELARYLASEKHGLKRFFDVREGTSLTVDNNLFSLCPPTFHNRAGAWEVPARIFCLISRVLPKEHFLRVYHVLHISAAVSGGNC